MLERIALPEEFKFNSLVYVKTTHHLLQRKMFLHWTRHNG